MAALRDQLQNQMRINSKRMQDPQASGVLYRGMNERERQLNKGELERMYRELLQGESLPSIGGGNNRNLSQAQSVSAF